MGRGYSENDQTSVPNELIQTCPEGETRDFDISADLEAVFRENEVLRQQLEASENTIRLLQSQIESTEQLLYQPTDDQDDLSSKKQLEEEIAALRSERDSLSSQLSSLHQDLLLSSSSSALHQNNVLLTAIVEDEANNTGSLNLLLDEKSAEVYRLKNELAAAQSEKEAFQRRAEEAERLLEEEAKVMDCLRTENQELMKDLNLLGEQPNSKSETPAEMEKLQKELEFAQLELETQKSTVKSLRQQILEMEKRASTGVDLATSESKPEQETIVPEMTGKTEESFAPFPESANGRMSAESSLHETEEITKDSLEPSIIDASDVAGLSLLQVHRETLQELDTMRSRAEEAESTLLRCQASLDELHQQLISSQQETAEWRSQAEKRSLEFAAMAQEAQSQRLRAEDLEDVRQGLLEALNTREETPSKTAEWQTRVETAEKETAKWRSQVEEMTEKMNEMEELVRTHQFALSASRAEIAAVAQTVSMDHAKMEEANKEVVHYKESFENAIAEVSR